MIVLGCGPYSQDRLWSFYVNCGNNVGVELKSAEL